MRITNSNLTQYTRISSPGKHRKETLELAKVVHKISQNHSPARNEGGTLIEQILNSTGSKYASKSQEKQTKTKFKQRKSTFTSPRISAPYTYVNTAELSSADKSIEDSIMSSARSKKPRSNSRSIK